VEPGKRDAYEQFIMKEYIKKIPEAGRYIELEPDKEKLLEYEKKMKEAGKKPNYDSLLSYEQHVERTKIVIGAGERTFVIFSGGAKAAGDAVKSLKDSTQIIMDAGGEGRIIGRNFWGIPIAEGLKLSSAVTEVMRKPEYRRKF
jgi:DhnA family fructose-bisphosphate aldolase class Ia